MNGDRVLDVRPSLSGRVALVTGGAGGIGRVSVEALLAHGANVTFTSAEGRELPAVAAETLAAHAGRASVHGLDLRSASSIAACMAEVITPEERASFIAACRNIA